MNQPTVFQTQRLAMLFNSFEFLLFFPIVLLMYYLLPHKLRWLFLLASSYYFYASSEPYLIILLLISTMMDYYCGLKIGKVAPERKKYYLWLSMAVNVGILVAFKYLFFFMDSTHSILEYFGVEISSPEQLQSYRIDQILLPVGISFYTFQTMSYTIEVYRGNIEPEKHLGRFALFVAFFPQLVAGPIEKATRLLPQLKKTISPDISQIKRGMIIMAWGFFLKIVVADRLGIYVDAVYADPDGHQGLPSLLAAFFFVFQIYFDFAAYTYIAIGAAKTMGISLINNFNRPLFSINVTQFWQRWHISLTQWIRDYLYSPLRRKAHLNRLVSVLLVFLIMGLWHGANWTFVVWGLLNALFLIIEVATNKWRKNIFDRLHIPSKLRSIIGWAISFTLMMLSLIFFRSASIQEAIHFIGNLFVVPNLHINVLNNYLELFLSILLIVGVQWVHFVKGNNRIYELVEGRPVWARWSMYLAYIAIIVMLGINRQESFIYFQF